MTKKELVDFLKQQALDIVKSQAPYRTGNLMDSIKVRDTADGFEVYIDEAQAPYAPYTIEPWISPKWKGKKNPNQYWNIKGVDKYITTIQSKFQ